MELKLEKTCNCSPEQYDVYIGSMKVGYIRCRWGHITVSCPSVGGEQVYSSIVKGYGSLTSDEREYHLDMAKKAIELWNKREQHKYQVEQKLIKALDHTTDVIHEYLYGCGVHDEALEKLADTLDHFIKVYEK